VRVIRPATARDVDAIIALCAEHAAYERAAVTVCSQPALLRDALFAVPPRLWCLVVETRGTLVGYATYTREFSTWQATDYLHVDCLYLQPSVRGAGIGAGMMDRIAVHAHILGCDEIQWQTPVWNVRAMRFYDRLGALRTEKCRYRWRPREHRDEKSCRTRGVGTR
jgi:GNAT superfamily N-acetyltransferase